MAATNGYSISCWETSVDTVNNKSYVKVTGTAVTNSGTYNKSGSAYMNFTASIGGQKYSSGNKSYSIDKSSSASITVTLGPFTHNVDGTLGEVSISSHCYITSDKQFDASAKCIMSTIARKSSFSRSGDTLDSSMSVTISSHSNTFSHKVYFKFAGSDYSLMKSVAAGTYSTSFTPAASTYAKEVTNLNYGTAYIKVDTYSGNSCIGSAETSFVCYIKNKPTISAPTMKEAVTSPDIAGKIGAYVQNKSKISFKVNSSGVYESTIKSYSVTINGKTYTESSFTTDVLSTSGKNTYKITVTDTRGNTQTYTGNFNVLEYSAPKISYCLSKRTSDSSTAGTVTFSGTITSLNSKNTKSFVVKYKKSTDSSYTTASTISDNYSQDKKVVSLSNLNTDYTYNILVIAYDLFSSFEFKDVITTSFELVNFRSTLKGIAVGKVSEKDNELEIGIPTVSTSSFSGTAFNNTSLVSQKKNIEKFLGALDVIKNIDLYKFNYINENDTTKKHIGCVVGDNYNYSSEITSVDEEGKETGIDMYSMVSLCLQAIKELQEIIENSSKE